MNIDLKPYQKKAVSELIASVKSLLVREAERKVCVFQAPTGSGKTLMTAKFIEEIIKELPEENLSFVWLSTGKGDLHLQSKHSLERIFGGAPRVSLVEEEFTGGRDQIIRNEVVVANWQKLWSRDSRTGEWKVVLMKDGEKINFRDVLAKTKEQRKIVLIIDESHIGKGTVRTSEVLEIINADITLEMSATPKYEEEKLKFMREMESPVKFDKGASYFIYVQPKDVIDEGMIKKELIINEKIDEIVDDEIDSQEIVLEAAYKKRQELKNLYKAEKSKINPLVLIQIPTAEAGKDKIKAIREFLSRKSITEKNGKLAIWLAEQKSETLDWIAEPDNEIEYLIFKQAIDTGWDCPRAHILVKFREIHSEVFEIQTVGRILRMPEQKHYFDEDLNRGYIYTNVQSIFVKKEEYNPNIIKHIKAIRSDKYKKINLVSYYKSRADYGDITSSFAPVFEKNAYKHFGLRNDHALHIQNIKKLEKRGINLNIKKYQQEIIANAKIEGKSFDEIKGRVDSDSHARLVIAGNDLQAVFEQIIKDHLGSFKNVKRSVPSVKTAIYSWFRNYLGSKQWMEEITLVQMIFVQNGNRKIFEEILARAIQDYKDIREEEIRKKAEESEQWYEYEIAEESFYNQYSDEKMDYENYIYKPCYLNAARLNPEKRFEKLLKEMAAKVVWWWKNGENNRDYLGIKYEYSDGDIHTFYPDYLVQLASGQLGIIEVKDIGDRDGETYTKAKAEKLQEYIKQQKNKKLFGGIAIEKSNVWKINQKEKYIWNKCEKNDWSDWEALNI